MVLFTRGAIGGIGPLGRSGSGRGRDVEVILEVQHYFNEEPQEHVLVLCLEWLGGVG